MSTVSALRSPKSDHADERNNRFIELSSRYAEFAGQAGIELIPYRDRSLPAFNALSAEDQSRILHSLSQRVSICDSAFAQGDSMANSKALTWAALRAFGLRPPSDLINYIDSDSIVEMHDRQGSPIFQSFSYYRYCSYTLEEMTCGHWSTLYERPEWVIPMIVDFLGLIHRGERKGVFPIGIPAHVLSETGGKRYICELHLDWGAPLYEQGSSSELPIASIAIDRVKLLGVGGPGIQPTWLTRQPEPDPRPIA